MYAEEELNFALVSDIDVRSGDEDQNNLDDSKSQSEGASQNQRSRPYLRSVYLITNSRADLSRFPTRSDFQTTRIGMSQVVQWVCSREQHKDNGTHYYMAVKLSHPR